LEGRDVGEELRSSKPLADSRDTSASAGAVTGVGLAGRVIAGALGAGLALIAASAIFGWTNPTLAQGIRGYLAAGGWLPLVLLGAAIGAFGAAVRSRRRGAWLATIGLLLAAFVVGQRVGTGAPGAAREPKDAKAKARAFLKWSYRSPQTVAMILPYAADPDPTVREQAVLAMGVNLIVTDIEHATSLRPARYEQHPVRDSLRVRLLSVLRDDPIEAVRAEAARALWNAQKAFGEVPSAAETLAAALDRAPRSGRSSRATWLALDAAAGAPDSTLKAAAARLAASTSDTTLARVATMASRR
jgi:hypothetical protein